MNQEIPAYSDQPQPGAGTSPGQFAYAAPQEYQPRPPGYQAVQQAYQSAPPVQSPQPYFGPPTQSSVPAYAPAGLPEQQFGAPPPYGAGGFPGPFPQPIRRSSSGKWFAIIGGAVVVAIVAVVVATQTLHKTGTDSGVGFNNPNKLAADLTTLVDDRLSDPSGQYYAKGVSVTSVGCVLQSGHTFTCVVHTSDGDSASDDVVVSADGKSYVTK